VFKYNSPLDWFSSIGAEKIRQLLINKMHV